MDKLWLPDQDLQSRRHGLISNPEESPFLQNFYTYVTHEELFGYKIDEEQIIALLRDLSAYDCLASTGRLSCLVGVHGTQNTQEQLDIVARMGLSQDFQDGLARIIAPDNEPERTLFFPQQCVHLARLAILHADPRPSDGFRQGKGVDDFLRCLFGITDILDEGPGIADNQGIGWALRQQGVNDRPDTLYLTSRYYEIFMKIWPEVETPEAIEVNDAFERYTDLTLEDYFTIGMGVTSRFRSYALNTDSEYALVPDQYFSSTEIDMDCVECFLSEASASLEELRDMINEENKRYGPTTFRCHTFDRKPLLKVNDDLYFLLDFAALERKATEGVFWILSNGSQDEDKPIEHFTSPFGAVFECYVQETFVRTVGTGVGEERYMPPIKFPSSDGEVDSSDAAIFYESDVIFVEAASVRPEVKTITRGDRGTYKKDLRKILGKAEQLDHRIRDFRQKRLQYEGIVQEEFTNIWPLLVVADFPGLGPINDDIREQAKRVGYFTSRGCRKLTIIDADDLAFLEALVDNGFTYKELIEGWQRSPYWQLTIRHYVNSLEDERCKNLDQAAHHGVIYGEFTQLAIQKLFPDA